MESAGSRWQTLFEAWPADMPKRGLLMASFGEQVPFDGFMIGGELLLLQRATPDSLGARTLVIPFDQIVGLKFTDVVRQKSLQALGFQAARAG